MFQSYRDRSTSTSVTGKVTNATDKATNAPGFAIKPSDRSTKPYPVKVTNALDYVTDPSDEPTNDADRATGATADVTKPIGCFTIPSDNRYNCY